MTNYEPSRTRCYCGSSESFEFCADCRSWLVANSLRIVDAWRGRLAHMERFGPNLTPMETDSAESYALAAYLRART